MKEGNDIQEISKKDLKTAYKLNLIKPNDHVSKTKHKRYIKAALAMKIWRRLGVNKEKVANIQQDENERYLLSRN